MDSLDALDTLCEALHTGNTDLFNQHKHLLGPHNINRPVFSLMMEEAINANHDATVRMLFSVEGIRVTPLMWYAAIRNGNLEYLQLMIDKGADINPTGCISLPLVEAVHHGQLSVVRWLLDHGANPNICTRTGRTPLMHAAAQSRLDLVDLLIAHGANIRFENERGVTAAGMALGPNRNQILELFAAVGTSSDGDSLPPQ